jgi:hypothetical protein
MIQGMIVRFREKGATTPEKAMTAQELGLPPRFEEAMKRRLGATGIFVDVGGRYYLDEAKLKQVQEERRAGGRGGMGGGSGSRGSMFALRIARRVVGLSAIILAVSNLLFVQSEYLRFAVLGLVVLWIALTVFQLVYLSRARARWGASGMGGGTWM